MAKSPSEQIRELYADVIRVIERLQSVKDEIGQANLVRVLERLAVLESLQAESRKREEENDRRRWQLWLAVGVCVLTFGANLTMNLLLFFARVKS